MIKYPLDWEKIGHEIPVETVAASLRSCILTLGIRNLSLSGGVDSTLLLYFMKKELGDPIHCFTVALSEEHPDFLYAKKATDYFDVFFHPQFIYKETSPDEIVRIFYEKLSNLGIRDIIAGDGIDEFACGYYSHLQNPTEENYIDFVRRLEPEHLTPLNKSSGNVSVYLPYLSPDIVKMLSLIPLSQKVSPQQRKMLIIKMATGKIPEEIINRRKYGFCDATIIKGKNESK